MYAINAFAGRHEYHPTSRIHHPTLYRHPTSKSAVSLGTTSPAWQRGTVGDLSIDQSREPFDTGLVVRGPNRGVQ